MWSIPFLFRKIFYSEFFPDRRATETTVFPSEAEAVFARMRMLGQKCKNDSGRHKLSRDPITGEKLLVLR